MPRRANVRLAANLQPHADLRLEVEIAQRAVAGFFRPFADRLELFIFRASEKVARLLERAAQACRAKVILPPLEQHGRQLVADHLAHDRDVLAHELFLQIDRVGGNDPLAAGLERKLCSRQKVGERLSNAGARLGHQRTRASEGLGHRHGQCLLLRAKFEIPRFCQLPLRRKRIMHRVAKTRCRLAVRKRNHPRPSDPATCPLTSRMFQSRQRARQRRPAAGIVGADQAHEPTLHPIRPPHGDSGADPSRCAALCVVAAG